MKGLKKCWMVGLLATIMVAAMAPGASAVRYHYLDLGTLGGEFSQAYGINDLGQVVGFALTDTDVQRAFLKNPGQPMEDLGTLGGNSSIAYDINNLGQVVGSAEKDYLEFHAFLKNPAQPMEDLGTLEGGESSGAHAINNLGQVVGSSYKVLIESAFLKSPGEAMEDLGTLGGDSSTAYGINNLGQVVGDAMKDEIEFHAFLKDPDQEMADLGTLGGNYSYSKAYEINDLGQVVGFSYISDNGVSHRRAFLKSPGQAMEDLGTLGGDSSTAYGINDLGQVVGWSETTPGIDSPHAFLKNPGQPMQDLNSLVWNLPEGVYLGMGGIGGALYDKNFAINDYGWIVGQDSQGHAYLLIPEVMKYNYTFSYGDKKDYYYGYLYADSDYGYEIGQRLSTPRTESGKTGMYEITGATAIDYPAHPGEVYVSRYFDTYSRTLYTPVNSLLPAGLNYLMSESGYIIAAGYPTFYFGLGYDEADAILKKPKK